MLVCLSTPPDLEFAFRGGEEVRTSVMGSSAIPQAIVGPNISGRPASTWTLL
jgi:hypothetical protein